MNYISQNPHYNEMHAITHFVLITESGLQNCLKNCTKLTHTSACIDCKLSTKRKFHTGQRFTFHFRFFIYSPSSAGSLLNSLEKMQRYFCRSNKRQSKITTKAHRRGVSGYLYELPEEIENFARKSVAKAKLVSANLAR